jgi:hypothetical protein
MSLSAKEKDLKQVLSTLGVSHIADLKGDFTNNDEKLKEIE